MVSRNCLKISRDNIFVDKLQNDYWIVRENTWKFFFLKIRYIYRIKKILKF